MRTVPLRLIHLFLLLATLGSSPAAEARSITLSNEVVKFSDGAPVRRLAVAPASGRGGRDLTIALEAALPAVKVKGQPYFTVLAIPPGAASPLAAARRMGADAVLLAAVTVEPREGPVDGLAMRCVARNPNGSCAKTALVRQTCLRRAIRATAVTQVMRVSSGQVVYSLSKTQERGSSWCDGPPPKTLDALLAEVAAPLGRAIAQDLAPSIQKVQLKIKDDDKTLAKEPRANFRAAARTADKNLETACASWQALNTSVPKTPAVVFDMGVCAEVTGDFTRALERYQEASSLLPAGDVDVAEAVSRVQVAVARREEAARVERELQAAQAAEAAREARQAAEARRAEAADRKRAADRAAKSKADADARQAQLRAKYGQAAGAISRGQVQKGMTTAQVIAAKGQPSRRERLGPGDEQWYYPGQRVIFSGGRVTYIGS